MADPNPDNTNQRWLEMGMYGILVAIKLGYIAVVAQMYGLTPENKMYVFISFAALFINYHTTLWRFTQIGGEIQHNHLKTITLDIVSTFTYLLFYYSVLSIQAPDVIPWYGFPLICTVVTFVKGANVFHFVFDWCYQKLTTAVTDMIERLSVLLLRSQQLPTNEVV